MGISEQSESEDKLEKFIIENGGLDDATLYSAAKALKRKLDKSQEVLEVFDYESLRALGEHQPSVFQAFAKCYPDLNLVSYLAAVKELRKRGKQFQKVTRDEALDTEDEGDDDWDPEFIEA